MKGVNYISFALWFCMWDGGNKWRQSRRRTCACVCECSHGHILRRVNLVFVCMLLRHWVYVCARESVCVHVCAHVRMRIPIYKILWSRERDGRAMCNRRFEIWIEPGHNTISRRLFCPFYQSVYTPKLHCQTWRLSQWRRRHKSSQLRFPYLISKSRSEYRGTDCSTSSPFWIEEISNATWARRPDVKSQRSCEVWKPCLQTRTPQRLPPCSVHTMWCKGQTRRWEMVLWSDCIQFAERPLHTVRLSRCEITGLTIKNAHAPDREAQHQLSSAIITSTYTARYDPWNVFNVCSNMVSETVEKRCVGSVFWNVVMNKIWHHSDDCLSVVV